MFYKSLDFSKAIKFAKSPDEKIRYIKPLFSKPAATKANNSDTDDEDDFEGDYLGEVELQIWTHDLSESSYIKYKNKKDLDKKLIELIKGSSTIKVSTEKEMPLLSVVDIASNAIYEDLSRGSVTSLICSKKFLENHHPEYGMPDVDIITTDLLPENIALTVFLNDRINNDMCLVAYVNKLKKRFKFASLTRAVCLIEDN